jgi:hypothetical protein
MEHGMTTPEEVRAEIFTRMESVSRRLPIREALPFHDPLQLPQHVRSGDTSPLDDVLRRYRLYGVSNAY